MQSYLAFLGVITLFGILMINIFRVSDQRAEIAQLRKDYKSLETLYVDRNQYDGEGNQLPDTVVTLLVQSQFGHLTAEEIQLLNQYIYTRDCWVWVCD